MFNIERRFYYDFNLCYLLEKKTLEFSFVRNYHGIQKWVFFKKNKKSIYKILKKLILDDKINTSTTKEVFYE